MKMRLYTDDGLSDPRRERVDIHKLKVLEVTAADDPDLVVLELYAKGSQEDLAILVHAPAPALSALRGRLECRILLHRRETQGLSLVES